MILLCSHPSLCPSVYVHPLGMVFPSWGHFGDQMKYPKGLGLGEALPNCQFSSLPSSPIQLLSLSFIWI